MEQTLTRSAIKKDKKTGEPMWEIEKIVAKRVIDNVEYYLIKWKSFHESHNTWEPIDKLFQCLDIVENFETQLEKNSFDNKLHNSEKKQQQKEREEITSQKFQNNQSISSSNSKQAEGEEQKKNDQQKKSSNKIQKIYKQDNSIDNSFTSEIQSLPSHQNSNQKNQFLKRKFNEQIFDSEDNLDDEKIYKKIKQSQTDLENEHVKTNIQNQQKILPSISPQKSQQNLSVNKISQINTSVNTNQRNQPIKNKLSSSSIFLKPEINNQMQQKQNKYKLFQNQLKEKNDVQNQEQTPQLIQPQISEITNSQINPVQQEQQQPEVQQQQEQQQQPEVQQQLQQIQQELPKPITQETTINNNDDDNRIKNNVQKPLNQNNNLSKKTSQIQISLRQSGIKQLLQNNQLKDVSQKQNQFKQQEKYQQYQQQIKKLKQNTIETMLTYLSDKAQGKSEKNPNYLQYGDLNAKIQLNINNFSENFIKISNQKTLKEQDLNQQKEEFLKQQEKQKQEREIRIKEALEKEIIEKEKQEKERKLQLEKQQQEEARLTQERELLYEKQKLEKQQKELQLRQQQQELLKKQKEKEKENSEREEKEKEDFKAYKLAQEEQKRKERERKEQEKIEKQQQLLQEKKKLEDKKIIQLNPGQILQKPQINFQFVENQQLALDDKLDKGYYFELLQKTIDEESPYGDFKTDTPQNIIQFIGQLNALEKAIFKISWVPRKDTNIQKSPVWVNYTMTKQNCSELLVEFMRLQFQKLKTWSDINNNNI